MNRGKKIQIKIRTVTAMRKVGNKKLKLAKELIKLAQHISRSQGQRRRS